MGIEHKNVSEPDEQIDYGEQGSAARVTIGFSGYGIGNESTLWLSTLKPGWSWERNIQPSVPFSSCPLHHREYVASGRIRYEVAGTGEAVEAGAGSYLDIQPGHLASVVGDEPAVLVDFDERWPED